MNGGGQRQAGFIKYLQKFLKITILSIGVYMRKRTVLVFFLFLITALVFSGDIAIFQNLGFSPDSKYFMFGQHGVSEKNSSPYAEICVVDVAANRFVPNGRKQLNVNRSVGPGNDGRGALFNLLEETITIKQKYLVDHTITGRLLYILVDYIMVDAEKPGDALKFEDFQTGKKYRIALVQSASGSGKEIKSCFHLSVTVEEKSGKVNNYTVGHPNYRRKGVKLYRIKQILLGPDDKSLIFVIQKEEEDLSGSNIRFMVETLNL